VAEALVRLGHDPPAIKCRYRDVVVPA